MSSLYNKAFYFISGHGRGWAFSSGDLLGKFSRTQADNLLCELLKDGKIRRVSRGIYDYPKYSEFLEQNVSPDIDQVARAYARKFNWRIEILGDSALNMLGLSTQVVAKYIYLNDGANRTYDILGTTLEFKKATLKDIGFKYKESSLIVQALKALGKERITADVIKQIQKNIDPKMYEKILKDTQSSTTWIYETIKLICQVET
ncbi:DUF6088 family protein [Sulfurimonas sp.]|uniref:DUF6088 family protein n=1 Tax=Sulfurimonas sp. TaxID=2022749 RepID=UPI001A0C12DC|nr:DUF6088 family protein [Sulfurimonas sp.]MBE0513417.1 hypothetical protein [Sulfurimonas sp.]